MYKNIEKQMTIYIEKKKKKKKEGVFRTAVDCIGEGTPLAGQ